MHLTTANHLLLERSAVRVALRHKLLELAVQSPDLFSD